MESGRPRPAAAARRLPVQPESGFALGDSAQPEIRVVSAYDMQPIVRLALGSQKAAVGSHQIFENGNRERLPQSVARRLIQEESPLPMVRPAGDGYDRAADPVPRRGIHTASKQFRQLPGQNIGSISGHLIASDSAAQPRFRESIEQQRGAAGKRLRVRKRRTVAPRVPRSRSPSVDSPYPPTRHPMRERESDPPRRVHLHTIIVRGASGFSQAFGRIPNAARYSSGSLHGLPERLQKTCLVSPVATSRPDSTSDR